MRRDREAWESGHGTRWMGITEHLTPPHVLFPPLVDRQGIKASLRGVHEFLNVQYLNLRRHRTGDLRPSLTAPSDVWGLYIRKVVSASISSARLQR